MQIRASASLNYLDTGGSGSAQQNNCCYCNFHSHIILFTLKNLAVLSIYIPGWLPVDADQGFGFTKLSGYRRIWTRTATQLLLLLFSFSYNFVYFEKSHRTFPLFQAGYLGDSDRPTCLSRTGRPCDFSGPKNADKCELVSTQGYTYNIFQAGQSATYNKKNT
jgi:hypothetical protein